MIIFPEKLKAAIQYVASKTDGIDPVKLNYILYLSDVFTHTKTGKSLTGWKYIKKPGWEKEFYEGGIEYE